MAEKSIMMLATLIAIVGLLVGGVLTYAVFPREVTITKEVTKEVQVPVEVIKEVPVEVVKEVPSKLTAYRDDAIKEVIRVLDEEDFEEYAECDGVLYDTDQIKLSRSYDDFSITNEDTKDGIYTVEGTARLKYLDEDVNEKCYNTLVFSVGYEDEEDPVVEIDYE
jgi:hypothetical protein